MSSAAPPSPSIAIFGSGTLVRSLLLDGPIDDAQLRHAERRLGPAR
jgi:hypothetical protein